MNNNIAFIFLILKYCALAAALKHLAAMEVCTYFQLLRKWPDGRNH